MPLKLSIIIPFYNVEKYITECLQSVYNQDISETDYEVICVNDCSPDNSREIVLEFQKQHKNLQLIEHNQNKMLGAARNTGLRAASGKYVWFIDSDDYIAANCLKNLLETAETGDLDILQFNVQQFFADGKTENYKFINATDIIAGEDYLAKYFTAFSCETWHRLFKRNLLIDNDIWHREGVFFEDMISTTKAYIAARRMKVTEGKVYFYRRHDVSITSNLYKDVKIFRDFAQQTVDLLVLADSCSAIPKTVIQESCKRLNYIVFYAFNLLPSKQIKICVLKTLKTKQIVHLKKYLYLETYLFFRYSRYYRHVSFLKKVKNRIFNKSTAA